MYSYIVFVNGVLYKISVVIHQHFVVYRKITMTVLVYIMPRDKEVYQYTLCLGTILCPCIFFYICIYIWYHVELGSDQLLSLVSMRVSYGIFCTDEENVLITIFQTSVPSSSVFLTVCSLSLQSISVQLNGTLLMNLISLQIWISHFILKC